MPKKAAKKVAKKAAKKTVKKSVQRTMSKKAGRPKGSGKYGCETKAVRVPAHMILDIQAFIAKKIKNEKK